MTEHDPEHIPTDDELDVEGPNEGATGDVNVEEDLTDLEDDDGYGDEDEDY